MTSEEHDKPTTPDAPGARDAGSGPSGAPQGHDGPAPQLPEDAVVVIPMRNMVLFPGIVAPISLGRDRSVRAAQEAARNEWPVGIVLQREPEQDEPTPLELHRVGTVAALLRYLTAPDGTHHAVCQGEQRFRVVEYLDGYPYLVARIERIEEPEAPEQDQALEARLLQLKQKALEGLELLPQTPADLVGAVQAMESPGSLADLVASYIDIKPAEKQEVLETIDLGRRLGRVLELLNYRVEVLRLSQQISQETQKSVAGQQREYMLREQMKAIQAELGEGDAKTQELEELAKAVEEAGMPDEVRQAADKELRRLQRMPEASAEYPMVRSYLDWLIELPWQLPEEQEIDIARAREILDADHYGLDKIKRRILEYLAVRKLNPQGKAPILCFVGPPGVGKTSLGQSIARAMDRKFVRQSLGGTHDESEIRGHRRTYIGALPGNIIQGIRKAGERNCVFMLDEMDKLGVGFHGDPASALLEVLDPEQNSTFRDNYLGVPYDLSRVIFIGTANVIDTIPGPLRDRMEVIELTGYTEEEKVNIAQRYLVRRQLEANGLTAEQCRIGEDTLRAIIRDYTREAGCRNLEREIGAVCRHVAMRIAEGTAQEVTVAPQDLHEILGPRRFEAEVALRTQLPGVVTGLAWTAAGGDILFVEANRSPGKGNLILTGHLGDVMKESAQAALSLVKSRGDKLGLDAALFEKSDIHIHVPAGAIPKDGPSAGVAMYVALVSLLTERTVREFTAMTGEISLRGQVLPVGGIKEKVGAALRAGVQRVLLPARNRKEFEEVPEEAKRKLEFVWVDHIDEAVAAAIGNGVPAGTPGSHGTESPERPQGGLLTS